MHRYQLLKASPIERETYHVGDGRTLPIDPRDDSALPRGIHDEPGLEPKSAAAMAENLVRAEPEHSPP